MPTISAKVVLLHASPAAAPIFALVVWLATLSLRTKQKVSASHASHLALPVMESPPTVFPASVAIPKTDGNVNTTSMLALNY